MAQHLYPPRSSSTLKFATNRMRKTKGEFGQVIIRSRAPLRVSFSGGGTDVPPYTDQYGGVVLSSTIRKYAYCTITPTNASRLVINNVECTQENGNGHSNGLEVNGYSDLARAAAKRIGIHSGLEIQMSSDCPPGSGMGSSSALVVAVIGALCEWSSKNMERKAVAELAHEVERTDVGIPGGMQDQYAAAFGGFNFMEFGKDGVRINHLSIPQRIRNELEYRMLLCSTGMTRPSGGILSRQIKSYKEGNRKVLESLHEIKRLTFELNDKLVHGDTEEFGALLGMEWELKKKLDPAISNEQIDKLYDAALENGSLGGKLLGAGGGGYLLLFSREGSQSRLFSKMVKAGSLVEGVRFEDIGVETWRANNGNPESRRQANHRNHLADMQQTASHAV